MSSARETARENTERNLLVPTWSRKPAALAESSLHRLNNRAIRDDILLCIRLTTRSDYGRSENFAFTNERKTGSEENGGKQK